MSQRKKRGRGGAPPTSVGRLPDLPAKAGRNPGPDQPTRRVRRTSEAPGDPGSLGVASGRRKEERTGPPSGKRRVSDRAGGSRRDFSPLRSRGLALPPGRGGGFRQPPGHPTSRARGSGGSCRNGPAARRSSPCSRDRFCKAAVSVPFFPRYCTRNCSRADKSKAARIARAASSRGSNLPASISFPALFPADTQAANCAFTTSTMRLNAALS